MCKNSKKVIGATTTKTGKIFVINLDRSKDRWNFIRKNLQQLNLKFERISAVDGKLLTKENLGKAYSEELNRERYYAPLNKSEIGCYLSHLKVCNKILEENLDYGIILEDDVTLSPEFSLLPDIINNISKKWEYIKLTAIGRKKKIVKRQDISFAEFPTKMELVEWNKPPVGTQAYIISKGGAEKFVSKRSVFFRPIDVDLQYPWETDIQIFGLIPFFVKERNIVSDIGHIKPIPHYPLARIIYKLKFLEAKFTAKVGVYR